MTNLAARMKTYNFWISFVSAIILVLRIIGDKFNFFVDATLIMDITTGLCGIFVVLGIISAPSGKKEETKVEDQKIGRFEILSAESKEENAAQEISEETITSDSVSTEIVEDEVITNETEGSVIEFEEVETLDAIAKNSTHNVENCVIIEEKIQPTNENVKIEEDSKAEQKAEIAEILNVLLEKLQNL